MPDIATIALGLVANAATGDNDQAAVVASDGGVTAANGGTETFVLAVNTDASPHNVTITNAVDTPASDLVVTVAAGAAAIIGPLSVADWGADLAITGADATVLVAAIMADGYAVETYNTGAADQATTDTVAQDTPAELLPVALTSIDTYIDSLDTLGGAGTAVRSNARTVLKIRRDLVRLSRLLAGTSPHNHEGN